MASPYELTVADASALHPRLRAYFGEIPGGFVGVGEGIFDTVGTPKVWLWPVLWMLGRRRVMFATRRHGVPFTVKNTPGDAAVHATRTFHFPRGDRSMVDAITAVNGELIDFLGSPPLLAATLEAGIVDGALTLRSTGLSIRLGGMWLRVPRRLAPSVSLVERFDDETGRQHVSLTVDLAPLGRLYEYAGSFTYEIRPGE